MSKLVRIAAIVFLAAFAASTAARAAVATVMTFEMSMAEMGEGGMSGCQDCPGDDARATCDQFCLTASVAVTTHGAVLSVPPANEALSLPTALPAGITGPPDRHPPRTVRTG